METSSVMYEIKQNRLNGVFVDFLSHSTLDIFLCFICLLLVVMISNFVGAWGFVCMCLYVFIVLFLSYYSGLFIFPFACFLMRERGVQRTPWGGFRKSWGRENRN